MEQKTIHRPFSLTDILKFARKEGADFEETVYPLVWTDELNKLARE